jgi:hypothetical protein
MGQNYEVGRKVAWLIMGIRGRAALGIIEEVRPASRLLIVRVESTERRSDRKAVGGLWTLPAEYAQPA